MGLLNLTNDGLPSVLFALVRTLRRFGPMPRKKLLAFCCPPTLQAHTTAFEERRHGSNTLNRWLQLGLFRESADLIELRPEVLGSAECGLAEVREVAPLLRRLVLDAENNRQLNVGAGELAAADFTLGVCWVLAQDTLALPGGAYHHIQPIENRQFGSQPYAFQNDTRWNGFRAWAPLLGFGWLEVLQRNLCLVVDPTPAVGDALPAVFATVAELPVADLLERLAEALPVLDGGTYRTQVEARLMSPAWRATRPHEVSVSLSVALKRLEIAGAIVLERRADAPMRSLLGRGHREFEQVSHVVRGESGDA